MGVALGAGSTTEAVHPVDKEVVLNGKAYAIDSSKTIGVVSTGTADTKRQIINVAPGKVSADSTDAINGSQLNAAYDGINQLGIVVKDQGERLTKAEGSIVKQGETLTKQGDTLSTATRNIADQGGRIDELNTTVKDQGARLSSAEDTLTSQGNRLTTATKNIADHGVKIDGLKTTVKDQGERLTTAEGTLTNQGDRLKSTEGTVAQQNDTLKAHDQKFVEQGGKLDTLKQELSSGKTGLVQSDASGEKLAIGAGSDAKTVDFSGVTPKLDAGGKPVVGVDGKPVMEKADRVLTGIADGTGKNDAVNKGQLDKVSETVTAQGGEIKTLQKDALLHNGTAYDASHGADETSRIVNVAAGIVGTDVVNKSQLDVVDTAVKDQGVRLTTAEGTIVKQGETLTKQGDTLATATKNIADQGGRLTTAEGAVKSQGEALVDQGGKMATLDTTVKGQGDRLTTTEGTVAKQGGRLTTTEGSIVKQGDTLTKQGDTLATATKDIANQGSKLGMLAVSVDEKVKSLGDTVSKALDGKNPDGVAAKTAAVESKVTNLEQKAVTYGTKPDGTKNNEVALQGGDPNAPVLIKNVAEGTEDKDAVNVGQLKTASTKAKSYTDEVASTTLTASKQYSDTLLTRIDNLPTKASVANVETAVESVSAKTKELDGRTAVLEKGFNKLSSDINSVRKEAHQAAAVGLAASSLRFDNTPGKVSVAAGGAVWRDQGAMAFGAGYTSESGKIRTNLTGATSGGEFGVSAGISFTLN